MTDAGSGRVQGVDDWNEDELAMIRIMQSMGIDSFDKSLPTALNEYARRYAMDLLCDGKDYSVHSGKKVLIYFFAEVDSDDIRLAAKLSDNVITGVDSRVVSLEELKRSINTKPLETLMLESQTTAIKYPQSTMQGMQRSFTFVPGTEAYFQFIPANQPQEDSNTMDTS